MAACARYAFPCLRKLHRSCGRSSAVSSIPVSNLLAEKQQVIGSLMERNGLFAGDVLEVLKRITSSEDLNLLSGLLQNYGNGTATVGVAEIQSLLEQSADLGSWPGLTRLQQLFSQPRADIPSSTPFPAVRI